MWPQGRLFYLKQAMKPVKLAVVSVLLPHIWVCLSVWEENRPPGVVVGTHNVPSGLRYLNSWSAVGGAIWEGYGTFRTWYLGEESTPERVGLEDL